jgi:hypothetical protein
MLEIWDRNDWLIYFLLIPLVILIIFILPQPIKDSYFILNLSQPTVFSIFIHNYTHSSTSHLANNLVIYRVTLFSIFKTETYKMRFNKISTLLLLALPFISSLPLFLLSSMMPPAQGFSAIGAGFLG